MSMNVLFLSPHYPPEMPYFTRGLAEAGAKVYTVSDAPLSQIPDPPRRYISGHFAVPNLMDERQALAALLPMLRGSRIDRIETLWEPLISLAGALRDALGIEGLTREEAVSFRDKGEMKRRLVAAGLPVPKARRERTENGIREAVEEIGYPAIIKPIAGAGSADTHRVNDRSELERVLPTLRHVEEVSVEVFIDGREFTYDTISFSDSRPVFESVTEYYPRPMIARNQEWISPAQMTFRDPFTPLLQPGIELGRKVLKALGRGAGFSHMEWYLTSSGQVYVGEIGARCGGGVLVDQMNWANDFDIFRGWAKSVCWDRFDEPINRSYFVATTFKRAYGKGRITRYENLDHIYRFCGPWIVANNLVPIGTHRRDWKQTLLSDGYITVRHPDETQCQRMMWESVKHLKVYAQ
jgi:hypothetical protein